MRTIARLVSAHNASDQAPLAPVAATGKPQQIVANESSPTGHTFLGPRRQWNQFHHRTTGESVRCGELANRIGCVLDIADRSQ